MAVITYKCDTCNRTIDKTQNLQGLEVVNHCVITAACKGSLFKVGTKGSSVARGFPPPVAGLADWRARRVIYDHTQNVESNVWKVDHNLNTNPSVQVYINRSTDSQEEVLVEVEPIIEYSNKNSLLIRFDRNETGVAQCISRNATRAAVKSVDVIQNIDLTVTADVEPILTRQTMTIATLITDTEIEVGVQFLSNKDLSPIEGVNSFTFGSTTSRSLWYPHETVFIKGKFYKLHSCLVDLVNLVDSGVKDGSFFYFNTINNSPIKKGDAFLMLSKSPNESSVDRDVNNVVDLSIATNTDAAQHFVFYGNDMHVSTSSKQLIFPAVQISQ